MFERRWRPPGRLRLRPLRLPELEAHLLYELKFEEARKQFNAWQRAHPEDPLGSASEAASYNSTP